MPILYGIQWMEDRAREAVQQARPYLADDEYVECILVQPEQASDPADAMVQTNRRYILCSPNHVTAILPRAPSL